MIAKSFTSIDLAMIYNISAKVYICVYDKYKCSQAYLYHWQGYCTIALNNVKTFVVIGGKISIHDILLLSYIKLIKNITILDEILTIM